MHLCERTFVPLSARKYFCDLEPEMCIINLPICPLDYHPLNCDTCSKTPEECLQKHNSHYKVTGCASHSNAGDYLANKLPIANLVKTLISHERECELLFILSDVDETFQGKYYNWKKDSGYTTPGSVHGPAKILVVKDP